MAKRINYYKHPITGEIREIPRNECGSIRGGFYNDLDALKWMRQWDLTVAYLQGNKDVRFNAVTNRFELNH